MKKVLYGVSMIALCLFLTGCTNPLKYIGGFGKKENKINDNSLAERRMKYKVSIEELYDNMETEGYSDRYKNSTMMITNLYTFADSEGGVYFHKSGYLNAFPSINCGNSASLGLKEGDVVTIRGDVTRIVGNSTYYLDGCEVVE